MTKKGELFLIGIDEVGRGPLAGPVVVCAVKVKKAEHRKILKGVNCSKKMTEKKREEWVGIAKKLKKEGVLDFSIRRSGERMIDKKGINWAIRDALNRSIKSLNADSGETEVLLDGLLSAPVEFKKQQTIIKGDEKEPVISLASVIAKVYRDDLMKKYSLKYPEYGFENHKGYGTALHRRMINLRGPCALHRKTFLKNII